MAVDFLETLPPCHLYTLADQFKGDGRTPESLQNSEALQFNEIAEEAGAQDASGFVTHVANEMHCAIVVSVKLFVVWAVLLGQEYGGADSIYLGNVIKTACDFNRAPAIGLKT
jgi:hypothetical protein